MKRDQEELMMLHDGELSEREARAAEERAAKSPEDRARLDAMEEMGELLRARMDLAMQEAPGLDRLWSKIDARLPQEEETGFFAWLTSAKWYFATGAVAAAAGALLMLYLRPPRDKVVIQTKYVEVAAPAPAVIASEKVDAEVESLEVNGGTGTVFHIPKDDADDDDAPTTVIWVTRDEPGPEDPI